MRWWFWLVVAAVLAVQVAFIPALRPLGVVPNLALVLVVLVGLRGTASLALGVALAGGLLLDLTSGADFGLRLGLLVLVALATGFVHRAGLQASGTMLALAMVAAGTVVADLTVLAGLIRAGIGHWPVGSIMGTMLLEIMLNLSGTLALAPLIRWVTTGGPELPGLE
jgi:Ca2+/Na+ antiporter